VLKRNPLQVTKGEGNLASYATGKEERYWCKRVSDDGLCSPKFLSPLRVC
jgi:hypothetical protein